jgi:hypothetical protein
LTLYIIEQKYFHFKNCVGRLVSTKRPKLKINRLLRLQIHVVIFISVNVHSTLYCGDFKVANGNLTIPLVFTIDLSRKKIIFIYCITTNTDLHWLLGVDKNVYDLLHCLHPSMNIFLCYNTGKQQTY